MCFLLNMPLILHFRTSLATDAAALNTHPLSDCEIPLRDTFQTLATLSGHHITMDANSGNCRFRKELGTKSKWLASIHKKHLDNYTLHLGRLRSLFNRLQKHRRTPWLFPDAEELG